jgi:hypothetical protein
MIPCLRLTARPSDRLWTTRKSEYRRRFEHLFRDAGVKGAPGKQREIMRELHSRYCPDHARIVAEYAEAERQGSVSRSSNTYNLSATQYASRLLADGISKGWIRCSAT